MALETIQIQDKLTETFGESVFHFNQEKDVFSFEVAADKITAVILFLKNDPTLSFHFLTDLCGIHYPDNVVDRQFAVVYHMHNWYENKRIKIKAFINGENPEIKTISNIFLCSNWMERETYDFFGVKFEGHPDLRRILNMDDLGVHPMLKQYPLEDPNRVDKKDEYFGR